MQTGLFYWFGSRLPARERFLLIANAGFQTVMLQWGNRFAESDCTTQQLPDLARRAGLYVENIHTDFENANLIWDDGLDGDEIFLRYLSSVDACSAHEIPAMVLHLTSGHHPPAVNAVGLDRLRRLAERAEHCKINIAIENLRHPEHLARVYAALPSERLKFCYDSGHETCFYPPGDLLERFGGRLASVHLHDNDGTGDQHKMPGDGVADWGRIARQLHGCGYRGAIALEVFGDFSQRDDRQAAEAFLATAQQRAQAVARRVEACE